jgi:RNA polymerase sigma-70 factor (ECF subfamily)
LALAVPEPDVAPLSAPASALPEFEAVYDQYFRFVWTSARRLGVCTEAIDDLVQEVFIVIHAKLSTVRQPESLRSWIYGIVRRTVSSHRRSGGKDQGVFLVPVEEGALAAHEPSPLEVAERSSQLELLSALLAGLSDVKREVFILAELEEMSVPEIAAALEIPLNTAYSRLRHARHEFETALARRTAASKKRGLE